MVYNCQFVPFDKEVYCVGFRYGRTKPIVNRKPTLGIVKDDRCWRNFYPKIIATGDVLSQIKKMSILLNCVNMLQVIILQTPMRKQ